MEINQICCVIIASALVAIQDVNTAPNLLPPSHMTEQEHFFRHKVSECYKFALTPL